ncbi:MAG: signal peptidase I [Hellea sp.]|nr:signal peptidase I [Hellea sp.]
MTEIINENDVDRPQGGFKSLLTTIFVALLIAYLLRVFIFQPFTIPSASMEPNLIKGDYIITSKYSVGYGKYAAEPLRFPMKTGRLLERGPERGDIVVFKPVNNPKHYIKRVVGLPGDQVQMKSGELYLNDTLIVQTYADREGPKGAQDYGAQVMVETFRGESAHLIFEKEHNRLGDTPVYHVPAGHYFMMGDNRDNSDDSRKTHADGGIGFVPSQNIIGKAEFILFSAKDDFSIIKPWTWSQFRADRFFKGLQ